MKNLKKFEIKKSSLTKIKGGTSTTLYTSGGVIEVGYHAENEYEDTNGNGKFDEKDKFKGLEDIIL